MKYQDKLKIIEKLKRLSIDEIKEIVVEILETERAYTLNQEQTALRFWELTHNLIQYLTVKCALCKNDTKIGSMPFLNGMVIGRFEKRWICRDCVIEISEGLDNG